MPERLYEESLLLVADEREQLLGREKREKLVDVVQACLAGLAFLCLLPLLSLVALAVKLTSPGPVLYRGMRVGKGGRVFTIYKFRTLDEGAERDIGARLLEEHDHYYTPIGRFLKRTKLDEWPQLWNVMKGDMRFIGPRPVRPIFLDQFTAEIPHYGERFRVKPGITGLAQLRGGYYTRPQDKLRYELLYIRHYSVLFDLKILLLTLVKLFHRWLSLGALFLALFLFVSFTPASLLSSSYLTVWGIRFNVVHVLIGLTVICGGWFLSRRLPHHRLSLYRLPLYLPMGVFIVFSFAAAVFSPDPGQALRGAAYYGVTGFLIALAIANSQITLRFRPSGDERSGRHRSGGLEPSVCCSSWSWITSPRPRLPPRWSPPILSRPRHDRHAGEFLGVGGLSHPGRSVSAVSADPGTRARRERFLGGRSHHYLLRHRVDEDAAGPVCCGADRGGLYDQVFSAAHPQRVRAGHRPVSLPVAAQQRLPPLLTPLAPGLWGQGAQGELARLCRRPSPLDAPPDSGFLTLLLENGILGGGAMLWVVGTALFAIYRAYREVADEEIRSILWAVFCSILGFLISLAGFNAFSDLTLQVLFWGTVGIGLGVVTHLSGRRKEHLIDLKLGH